MRIDANYVGSAIFLTVATVVYALAGVALWWVWLIVLGAYTALAIL